MDKQTLIEYCMKKQGAYLDFPFGDGYAVVKVKSEKGASRIFAEIFTLKGVDTLTFSSDENTAIFLRETYPDVVTKGWHCPPVQAKYKSSVALNAVDSETLLKFADISFVRALSKL